MEKDIVNVLLKLIRQSSGFLNTLGMKKYAKRASVAFAYLVGKATLGACRAVAMASLLPAPVDPACPQAFIDSAYNILAPIGFNPASKKREDVQASLLKFIAEYARFEMGQTPVFFNAARELICAANGNGKPLVFDSFSGYGAIPAEAARLGCESMAFDLNPCSSSMHENFN